MAKLFANRRDPDQMAVSDLGLHCLPVTLLGVSRLQLVKKNYSTLLLLSCFTDMEEVTSTESSEPKVQKKSRKRVKAIHAKIKEQVCWFI